MFGSGSSRPLLAVLSAFVGAALALALAAAVFRQHPELVKQFFRDTSQDVLSKVKTISKLRSTGQRVNIDENSIEQRPEVISPLPNAEDQPCPSSPSSTQDQMNYIIAPTRMGKIRGLKINELGTTLHQFLGVPYATQPIRKLRFKPTQEMVVPFKEMRDATSWPPICLQPYLDKAQEFASFLNTNMTEECLLLNIWTPKVEAGPPIAVLVFIPGGSFVSGGISMAAYDGRTLAAVGEVVVVTVQYRVGVFGFLDADNKQIPGNMGISDMIMALKWIQENIHHFGGDPKNVTLFGQSAGAVSAGLLMTIPEAKPLFKRVILQSGSPMSLNVMFETGQVMYDNFTKVLGCRKADKEVKKEEEIRCIGEKRVDEILAAHSKMLDNFLTFFPTIPSDLLPAFPNEVFTDEPDDDGEKEELLQHEVLMGTNAQEETVFLHILNPDVFPRNGQPKLNSLEEAREFMVKSTDGFKFPEEQRRTFAKIALPGELSSDFESPTNVTRKMAKILGDLVVTCPVLKFAQQLELLNVTVYLYQFTHQSSQSQWPEWVGVAHHDEIPFVFGEPLNKPHLFEGEEVELSKRIIKTWTHFAKTGEMLPQLDGVDWPKYSVDDKEMHMELSADSAQVGYKLDESMCFLFQMAYDMINNKEIDIASSM